MPERSLDEAYFERVYADTDDPWNFAASPYEREKYESTLATLGERRFESAFEIGCSIGVLTAMLAARCQALLAVDINERALQAARRRCYELPNVTLARMNIPHDFPNERFDLIVLSEVGYYWSDVDLLYAIDRIASAARGGLLQLVHFRPEVADYIRPGDAVHAAFLADARFKPLRAERREKYRIDVLSVAG